MTDREGKESEVTKGSEIEKEIGGGKRKICNE